MKVYIGPYKNWFGPYQLAEKLMFWTDKHDDDRVHQFGDWLAHGFNRRVEENVFKDDRPKTWLYKLLEWIEEHRPPRRISIHIDRWDTWSMDQTLSMIILPMLKQLRATKQGSALVEDEDVPDHLKSTAAPPKENDWDTDDNVHKRWDWVMDEIIWTFEQIHPDNNWQEQYTSGNIDLDWVPSAKKDEKGIPLTYELKDGPNHTYKCDHDAIKAHQSRINNGLCLFGKYYQGLWD
jgi:hypothetical protein